MSGKVEKTYEERLHSLKIGCIILGVLQAISVASAVDNFIKGKGSFVTLILSIVLLAMLYFIYKYTKERNPLGPTLETIYGVLLIIDGILLCITIVGILFGVIYIVIGIGILNEAKYFKNEIANNPSSPIDTSDSNNPDNFQQ